MLTVPVNVGSECAIGIQGVCSTPAVIEDMKEFLVVSGKPIDAADPQLIVDAARDALDCESEECILRSTRFSKHTTKKDVGESIARFKPEGPANSTKLLNNNNIDDVLARLTVSYPSFYHMPFQMIDFAGEKDPKTGHYITVKGQAITPTDLGRIDMMRDVVGAGYDTFGVVLNTDKRTNRGIHWFSIFCDFRTAPYTLEYFNSSGNLPMKQVQAWLIKTETAIRDAGKAVRVVLLTGMIHQKDSDTECGPYSLYYIYNRLKGVPPENFQRKRIPDRLMIEFRRDLFR